MSDQLPQLDLRLERYLVRERGRAERDFPRLARRIRPATASRPSPSWLVPAVGAGLVIAIFVGGAGFSAVLAPWLAGQGGSGWAGVEAIGLGEGIAPISLAIVDGEGLVATRRQATTDELASHPIAVGDPSASLVALGGGEWLLHWRGSTCDVAAMLTVGSSRLSLLRESEDSCPWTVERGAVLRFVAAVDPGSLPVVLEEQAPPLDQEQAITVATASLTIPGPQTLIAVAKGRFGDFPHPAASTPASGATPAPTVDPSRLVWRVEYAGRGGSTERLFIDVRTGELLGREVKLGAQTQPLDVTICATYLAGCAGDTVRPAIQTGRADVNVDGRGGSIATSDWTYGLPTEGVLWTDREGLQHESGLPECLAPGASTNVKFAAVEVQVAGMKWRPVVWISCQ